ncbi:hypothetical protein ACW2QC_01805 [Virgibacillus sp. FSP13]
MNYIKYLTPLIAFLATVASGILNDPVKLFTDDFIWAEFIFIIYIFITIIMIIHDYFSKQIIEKEKVIKNYEDDIRNQTAGMLENYKGLNKFQLNEILLDTMRVFTEKHSYVISTQLYKYTVQHSIENRQEITVLKINFVEGFIDEREEQNSMMQIYYYIPTELYQRYYEAMFYIKKEKSYTMALIIDILDELNNTIESKDDVTETHATKFAFILLCFEALGLDEETQVLKDNDIEDAIRRKLKTGIMRGVLSTANEFSFNYISTRDGKISEKDGLIYLTKKIKIKGELHLFLITISKFIHDTDEPTRNIKGIGDEFTQLLIDKTPGIEYNKGEGRDFYV